GPGGDWSGAAGGRGCGGLAHHHCPRLVRSIDGSTADHAVRHPVCASPRVGAPPAGTEDGQQYGGSGRERPDGLIYVCKLRRGLKFHNGDDVTGDDVKFSFERYKGAGAKELGLRVRQVDVVDPLTVRFVLKEPWPDFMTFYGTTATAAGIV